MAKSKKRPVRRNRRVNRVKKNKGKRVLFATISFIAVVLLSLVALQYLNKNIQRDTALNRISQDELSEEIEKIDDKLNKIFADIDLRRNEIISKEVDKRAIDDINWEYKQVSIKTDEAQKIKKFNDGLERLTRLDNVEVDVNKSNDLTISTLSLYNFPTHKINFSLDVPLPFSSKTDTKPDGVRNNKSTSSSTYKPKHKTADAGREFAYLKGLKIKPKIVIIVDDIGANKKSIDELLKIPVNINLAVLPDLKYSHYAAERANSRGWDVLLHLPMEPKYVSGYTGIDAGKNALLTGLPKNEIIELVEKNIASVPHIKGVNNHMGSKFTENTELMNLVLKQVKKQGLFFIDSKTSPRSKGYEEAKKLGLKAAERDLFLDKGKEGERFIRKRVNELLRISKEQGFAVGICHPYPQTIRVLSDMLPRVKDYVEFIPASQIVS